VVRGGGRMWLGTDFIVRRAARITTRCSRVALDAWQPIAALDRRPHEIAYTRRTWTTSAVHVQRDVSRERVYRFAFWRAATSSSFACPSASISSSSRTAPTRLFTAPAASWILPLVRSAVLAAACLALPPASLALPSACICSLPITLPTAPLILPPSS